MIQILEVTDPERYAQYRREVLGLAAAAGGRFVVGRESRRQTLEGGWDPPVLIIVEFPSYTAAEGWYFSDAYQKGLQHRLAASVCLSLMAEEQAG